MEKINTNPANAGTAQNRVVGEVGLGRGWGWDTGIAS